MSRFTRLFVIALIAAMTLITLAVIAWRWDAYAQAGALSNRQLMVSTFALVFMPLWLGLGALTMQWMLTRPVMPVADDTRRVAGKSLIAAALLAAGVHLWAAAAAILGEPPGREFGVQALEVRFA